MKRKIFVLFAVLILTMQIITYSGVYHSLSSSSLINSDGISSSMSTLSSPIGGEVSFSSFVSLKKEEEMFSGCIYDGEKIWLVPYSYEKVIYYSKNGEANSVDISSYGVKGKKYYGGAFDGDNIYFAPYEAEAIMQINKETKKAELITLDKGANKYKGAAYDGENIWFFPATGKDVLKMTSLGEIKKYTIPYTLPEEAFCGGIFANEKIYLVPSSYKNIVILDCVTGDFSEIPISNACSGAVTDGGNIWFIPQSEKAVFKLNLKNNELSKINFPDKMTDSYTFSGGASDGRNIWMAPSFGSHSVKYDTVNGKFTSYHLENGGTYSGGAFDGECVWFAPFSAQSPLKIKGNNTPPTVQNIFINVNAGEAVEGELSANDADEGDKLKFSVVQDGVLGDFILDEQSGVFTYKAGSNAGVDEIYYKAADMYDESNIAKVTVTISVPQETFKGDYIDMWSHWAEDAAAYLKKEEIVTGEKVDEYSYFYPSDIMTRGQFIVWANSAFGFEGDINDNTLPFEDTKNAEKWIINAASAAYQNKLILGSIQDGKLYFNANEPLKRVEVLTIIHNMLKSPSAPDEMLDFDDRDTFPEWSLEILKSLKQAGVLKGYEDNTLRLYNKVTRAEAAQLLYETLQGMQKKTKMTERLK